MVNDGYSNEAIADKLGVTKGTVKVHFQKAVEVLRQKPHLPTIQDLTPTQREVCQMATDGKSNDAIASIWRITRGTVKVHLRESFKILNIKRRTELLDFFVPQEISAVSDINFIDDIDHEVIVSVSRGETDPQIAERLHLTTAHIQARVKRMVTAIEGRNRTDLAAWWRNKEGTLAAVPA
jgi:DNA-binding NarL/FixJ family response regulator